MTGEVLDFPSSRVRKCSTFAPGTFGLDRISVNFLVVSVDRFHPRLESVAVDRTGQIRGQRRSTSISIEGAHRTASVHLSAYQSGSGWRGRVDLNPSRLCDPDGFGLVPICSVSATLESMLQLAEREGLEHSVTSLDEVGITRVDIARDFTGVSAPSAYIAGLRPLPRTYAREKRGNDDPLTHAATSLTVGSNAGWVLLYDQHALRPDLAPRGSVRFEVQARKGWLATARIRTAADLSVDALEAMAWNRWEWSKMGTTVMGTADLAVAIDRMVTAREPGWTSTTGRQLLAMVTLQQAGLPVEMSANTRRKYDRLLAALTSATARPLTMTPLNVAVTGRLDFHTGMELAA